MMVRFTEGTVSLWSCMHEKLLVVLVEGTLVGPVFGWFQGWEITCHVKTRTERTMASEYEPWCWRKFNTIILFISYLQIETILFHSISNLS